ncbi:MAG: hypothetical protein RIR26_1132 [Pseudomonadota bacterium]|jgi:Tfp pilus assembly protein PilF
MVTLIACVAGCTSLNNDTPEARGQTASLELARQMVGQGEYQRAIQFLLPRSRQSEATAEVHNLLGLSFLGIKNPSVALKSFQAALKADTSDDDIRVSIGYTQILLGRLEESRKTFNEIIERKQYPMMEKVYLNMGLSYLQEQKCDKAVPLFKAALDIDPTYSAPYFNIGKCEVLNGKFKEAQAAFQRSVDFCQGCIEPQLELAAVSLRLGDHKKAQGYLEKILQAKPTGVIEKRAMTLKKQIKR